MSCHSDIAFAYSKVGWAKMQVYFGTLSQNDQGVIIDLIQDADKHLVHQDGDHLLSYTCVNATTPDMMLLWKGHKLLDDEDYYSVEMDEYGGDECNGGFYENPFDICVSRSIFINEDHTDDAEFDEISIIPAVESIPPMPIKATSVVIINDCVCPVCGNNKCSSSEKSCWKCGASL